MVLGSFEAFPWWWWMVIRIGLWLSRVLGLLDGEMSRGILGGWCCFRWYLARLVLQLGHEVCWCLIRWWD